MVIYKITNTINGKLYVGQTIKTLEQRKSGYRKELYVYENNIRAGRPIIHAMSKYGIENFKFEVLHDNINSIDKLNELEIEEIKRNKCLTTQGGYNVSPGGRNGPLSEETKRKISIANTGKKRGEDWVNPTGKRTIDLSTGVIYKNSLEAERKLNITAVRDTCIGLQGSTNGKVFRYIDENNEIIISNIIPVDTNIYETILQEYKKFTKESKRTNQSKGNILHIETGIVYRSTRHAADNTCVSRQSVSDILNGKKKSIKGQSFKYTKEVVTE